MVTSTDGKMFQPFFNSIWKVDKIIPVKNDKIGEKLYFCNPKDEADLMNRIYERKVLGYDGPKPKARPPLSFCEKFKKQNGRFPKFSELSDE
jgi:hypothetical protein